MFDWIKKLFWKRCSFCKEKKELFYYTWEVPYVPYVPGVTDQEICTDCANLRTHTDISTSYKNHLKKV